MKYYLLIGLIGLLSISCENDLAEVHRLVNKDQVAIEVAREVEMLYSDSAVVKVRINSPTLHRHLDKINPKQEFPDGIEVNFLNANFRSTSRMTANYAIRYEKENKVVVRDSVVWISSSDERLETEELIWEEGKDKVYTKKFVVIRRPEEIIYGHGFESNQDFTEWRINAIQGRKKIEGLGKELKN